MKNLARKICFGKDSKFTMLLILGVFAFVSLGCSNIFRGSQDDNPPAGDNRRTRVEEDAPPVVPQTRERSRTMPKAGNSVPSDAELENLVQASLQDFADAVDNEDFTDFRDTVSKPFRDQFTAAKFNETFKPFIDRKKSLVPIIRSTGDMTPTYAPEPDVATQSGYKLLNVNGVYSTTPLPTKFELQYIAEGGQWKLVKIRVEVM